MNEQPIGGGLVMHSRTQTLEVGQRRGIALPRLLSMAADNLLEAGVLGHWTSLLTTPSPSSDAVLEDGLWHSRPRGQVPFATWNLGWSECSGARRLVDAVTS